MENPAAKTTWEHAEIVKKISQNVTTAVSKTLATIDKCNIQITLTNPENGKKYTEKLNLSADFVKIIIRLAQECDGIGNAKFGEYHGKEALIQCMIQKMKKSKEEAENYVNQRFEVMKIFSSEYQKASFYSGVYTGRTDEKLRKDQIIGARLKRILFEITEEIVSNAFAKPDKNISKM